MIHLLFICIVFNYNQCSEISDDFCEYKYFDSIYWTGFDYKLTRNRDNNSYYEWTAHYESESKSFVIYDYKLFGKFLIILYSEFIFCNIKDYVKHREIIIRIIIIIF
jgi:hypothetical protein